MTLGRTDKVEAILAKQPELVESTDPQSSFTPMEWAAFFCDDHQIAQVLQRHGAKLDSCTAAALGLDAALVDMLNKSQDWCTFASLGAIPPCTGPLSAVI